MKRCLIVIMAIALAGCDKRSDGGAGEPDVAGNATSGVAFDYSYALTLPADRISDLQEEHARSCERLGVARCRITGLRYTVGEQGDVNASLSVKVASSLARAFGRAGVKAAEAAGGVLTGAEITGTDVGTDAAATATEQADVGTEGARITKALAQPDLRAAERAELLRQQARLIEQARATRATTAEQSERLADTPMTFAYRTGRGTGLVNTVRDAGDTALASIAVTMLVVLWALAALGPPLLLVAILVLLWRRWGRHWWSRIAARIDPA